MFLSNFSWMNDLLYKKIIFVRSGITGKKNCPKPTLSSMLHTLDFLDRPGNSRDISIYGKTLICVTWKIFWGKSGLGHGRLSNCTYPWRFITPPPPHTPRFLGKFVTFFTHFLTKNFQKNRLSCQKNIPNVSNIPPNNYLKLVKVKTLKVWPKKMKNWQKMNVFYNVTNFSTFWAKSGGGGGW